MVAEGMAFQRFTHSLCFIRQTTLLITIPSRSGALCFACRLEVVICCYKEGREKRNGIASGIKMEAVISAICLRVTSSFSCRELPSQCQGNLSHFLCV